jgi:hypothetical protein
MKRLVFLVTVAVTCSGAEAMAFENERGPGQYGNASVSSGAVVFLDESSVGPPNPGGPTELYRFDAVASGQADITVPHDGDPPQAPGVPAFSISARVR